MTSDGFIKETDRITPGSPKYIHRTQHPTIQVEDDRTGMNIETLKRAILDNLYYIQGKNSHWATPYDYFMALAYTVRDRIVQR
jgi:starch phosphorylase